MPTRLPKGPDPECGGRACCSAVTYSVKLAGDWSQGAMNFAFMAMVTLSIGIYIVTLMHWARSWNHNFYFVRIVLTIISLFLAFIVFVLPDRGGPLGTEAYGVATCLLFDVSLALVWLVEIHTTLFLLTPVEEIARWEEHGERSRGALGVGLLDYHDDPDALYRSNDTGGGSGGGNGGLSGLLSRVLGTDDPSKMRLCLTAHIPAFVLGASAVAGTFNERQWETAIAVETAIALVQYLAVFTSSDGSFAPLGRHFSSPRGSTRPWAAFLAVGHTVFAVNYYYLYKDAMGEPASCLYIIGKAYYYVFLAPFFVRTMRNDSRELRAARSVLLQEGGSGSISLSGGGKNKGSGNTKRSGNASSSSSSSASSPMSPNRIHSNASSSSSGGGGGSSRGLSNLNSNSNGGNGDGGNSNQGRQDPGSGQPHQSTAANDGSNAGNNNGYRPPSSPPTSFSPLDENSSDPLYCLMKPGMKIKESELDLEVQVGAGQYGDVWKAQLRNKKTVAAKRFRNLGRANKHAIIDGFSREVCLLASLEHRNVVEFVGAVFDYGKDDDAPPTLVVVTEYCANGSLFDYIGKMAGMVKEMPPGSPHPFPMRERLKVVCGIAEGVAFLHSRKPIVIHRDLKSQNILLSEDITPKVCDFGVSRTKTLTATMSQIGTPQWSAPEVLKGERYSERADVFSFAVCMWEVLTLRRPFPNVAPLRVASLVAYSGLRLPVPTDVPPRAAKLMTRCWAEKQQSRPSMRDVVAEMREICAGAQ